jgi:protein farnesyltransferase subunit beta
LSSVQNKWQLVAPRDGPADEALQDRFTEWAVSPYLDEVQVCGDDDRVGTIHPVYTIPERRVDEIKAYFAAKQGF